MIENIKMVVFDMAGTTINENNVVYKTLHKAIADFGIKTELDTVLEYGAGKEKHQAIKDVLSHLGKTDVDSEAIFTKFKILLDQAYATLDVKPISGVEKTMIALKERGIKVVLNTGYSSVVANSLLKKVKWIEGVYYDALITSDDVVNGRPYPDMIEKAIRLFDIKDTTTVLKAGDSVIDIIEGKNAHCGITIGVLSGAQTKEQLEKANPTYILDSLASLV